MAERKTLHMKRKCYLQLASNSVDGQPHPSPPRPRPRKEIACRRFKAQLTCPLISTGIHDMKDLGLEIDLKSVETNMVYFSVNHHRVSAFELVRHMLRVTDKGPVESRVPVMMLNAGKNRIRLVVHHQVTEVDIHTTLQKMRLILTP